MRAGTASGIAVAGFVLVGGIALAFAVGRFPVSLADLGRSLLASATGGASGLPPAAETVIWQIRGPRIVAAVLVGSALAVAGAAFQGLFRNPLVSPDILGASSGAALGAVRRHLSVARRVRHPGARLRGRPRRRRRRLR